VQEIVGAIKFHNSDEGWVMTNRTFTASAGSLAQADNIKLIDGHELKRLRSTQPRNQNRIPQKGPFGIKFDHGRQGNQFSEIDCQFPILGGWRFRSLVV
jgi:hypothetical protein